MEIVKNGVPYDMPPEELEKIERMQSELPPPTPSLEDRVAQTEAGVAEVRSEVDTLSIVLNGKEVAHENQ